MFRFEVAAAQERAREALRHWVPSARPRWAMMPTALSTLMIDTLLTTLSVLERANIAYTVHQGSLLGAAHLEGLLPWDIDGDLAILDEDADSVRNKVSAPLAAHGLALEFCAEHYYYTVRARPLFPIVEIILATTTTDDTGERWIDRHSPHRMFRSSELYPLRRYPFHGSYVMGPRDPLPVLERLYGDAGSASALSRFEAATLDGETQAFWRCARPLTGALDHDAIAARARRKVAPLVARARAAPWYAANGLYNQFTESARRFAGGR